MAPQMNFCGMTQ